MHRHPLPTPDEIFARLNQGAWFTQIDFADAYLQMEVEDDSKELVTINIHKGLFQYQRLPFGVKCAPGIFQEAMDRMITGLEGCAAYLDDVIVTGSMLWEMLSLIASRTARRRQLHMPVDLSPRSRRTIHKRSRKRLWP